MSWSNVLFGVGGLMVLSSLFILSRQGQLLFACIGAGAVLLGLYRRARERHT